MKKENLLHIFSHMPKLQTDRLLLRPMRVSDAADMYDYAQNPKVTEYLLWKPHPGIHYTRSYLEYLEGRYRTGSFYDWGIILKESNKMIGTCGFAHIDTVHNVGEIGYVLHPDHWGQGIAVEAAVAVLHFGFQTLGLHRIEARYMVGNDASRKVMEKLGMRFEGVRREAMFIKGSYRDIGTCALLVQDYRAQAKHTE